MVRKKEQSASSRLAKLTPPQLPVVLNRTRLFRKLDHATRLPLTWVAAPPGAGKTTLLASYLQTRAHRVIWYRFDVGDGDPSTLFHYLGLAVQTAAPRYRTRLPHLTAEYMAGLPTFTQRFFEQLSGRLRHPIMIVFDNYHEVPLDSLIHQVLPVGIHRLPHHIRMIALSRESPPVSYARLQVEQQLQTIDATELELTREEARQISRLQQTSKRKKPVPAIVDQLWDMTKGWMAGFILLLRHQRQGAVTNLSTQQSPQVIFDYLAGEVMACVPAETQKVLLTISVLSEVSPQMAQRLSSVTNAAAILEQLHKSRYFVERREDRVGWYRFHPLFHEFLLRRAEQTLNPSMLGELRRKAAALLMEAQREEDAVSLLCQAQAWDDYRALIRAQAPILTQQGRIQTLETWIKKLPGVEQKLDPWMDFWMANSRLLVAPQEATPLYESTMKRFQNQGEDAGVLLAWAGAVQSILVAATGMKRIHHLMQLFDEIHPEGEQYPSLEVQAVVAQAMAGAYMRMYPDRLQAREWLNQSVALADVLPPSMRASEMVMTTQHFLWLGEKEKAEAIFAHQQKAWANELRHSIRIMIATATTEAIFALYSGDSDRCRYAVQKGLDLASREGVLVLNGFLYAHAVFNELMAGCIQAARNYLELMQPFAMFGVNRRMYLVLAGWADLVEGQIDHGWQKCRQSWDILEAEGLPMYLMGGHCLVESQILRAKGQQDEANQMLHKVETIREFLPWYFGFGIAFLRAQWAFQEGDKTSGAAWLRRLLEAGKNSGQIAFIGWIPHEASRLFAMALELGIEVPYACEIIRKWQLKPPPDCAPENWPWRVKVRTLGNIAVEVDGKPLEKQRKTPHRLLELLTAIIAFGGKDVPISRLIDALWPDVDGDTAHENFKKSIARLRKLLAVEDVIRWEDGKISLNSDLCWVDAFAFERHAKQQDGRAMVLYTGPFLGDDEIPAWAVSRRERMHATYVSLVKHRESLDADRGQSIDTALTSPTLVTQIPKPTSWRDSK